MLIPFRLTKIRSNNGYRHRSKVLTELFTKYYLVFVAGRGESTEVNTFSGRERESCIQSVNNKSKGEKKNIEGIWIELSYSRGEASFKPSFSLVLRLVLRSDQIQSLHHAFRDLVSGSKIF